VDPRAALLAWYDANRRELPWRRTREPWAVWVSEVMLQQTRVETVIPYFERFLKRFPTPDALAAAPLEEVLALWSGLGYYRRARQLHAGARAVAAAGGRIPARAAELERLPGVGPYTAAAVASIAYGEAVPVLDGNVARVAARRLALAEDPARAETRRRLLAAAAELVDACRPGDSNQALMELGARVCTPRAPRCAACPLAAGCRGAAGGAPEAFPPPRRRRAPRRVRQVAALVEGAHGRLWLVRRAESEAVMPGLWEPPTVEASGRRAAEAAFAARFGGDWRLAAPVARLRHGITYREIELEARPARWRAAEVAEGGAAGWFTRAELAQLPLTGAARRLLAPPAAS
jgi:A/G-specific adenine glycosylase